MPAMPATSSTSGSTIAAESVGAVVELVISTLKLVTPRTSTATISTPATSGATSVRHGPASMLVDELGHRPPVSPHMGANLEEWLHLIGRGEGIDTAPAVISRYFSWPEVAFVPLVDAAPAVLVLARRRNAQDALVDDFVRLAVEIAGAAVASATPYLAVAPSTRSPASAPD
jgi:hypothetical protein